MKKILYVTFFVANLGFAVNLAGAQTAASHSYLQNLTIGSNGPDVSALQSMLNSAGFLKVAPTGYFGLLTQAALASWQASAGISPSVGYFGPITRAYISNMNLPAGSPSFNSQPSISVSLASKTVAEGGKVALFWNSENAPAGSVVALTLTGSSQHADDQIALDLPSTGSYAWTIPQPTAQLWTDDSYVQSASPGNYQINAELYSPKGGYGGSMIARSQQLIILASSTSPVFQITDASESSMNVTCENNEADAFSTTTHEYVAGDVVVQYNKNISLNDAEEVLAGLGYAYTNNSAEFFQQSPFLVAVVPIGKEAVAACRILSNQNVISAEPNIIADIEN